jgi:hypothetical protein
LTTNFTAQDKKNIQPAQQCQNADTAQGKLPLEYRGLRLGMSKDAASELLRGVNAPSIEQENVRRARDVETCMAGKEDKATEANYLLTVRNSAQKQYAALIAADPVLPTEIQIQRMRRLASAQLRGREAAIAEQALQSQEAQLLKFTGTQSWSEFKQKYGDGLSTPEKLPDGVRLYIAILSDSGSGGQTQKVSAVLGELVDAKIQEAQRVLHAAKAHTCELAAPLRTPQCGDPECEGSIGGVVVGMNKGRISSIRQDNLEDVDSYVAAFAKKYGKPRIERHNRSGLEHSWIWERGGDRLEIKDVCSQMDQPVRRRAALY